MSYLAPHLSWGEVLRESGVKRPGDLPLGIEAALWETGCVLWTPIREAWGRPLRVTSGYRTELANRACGGARRSQHMRGTALDLAAETPGLTRALWALIGQLMAQGAIRPGGIGLYLRFDGAARFVHVDRRGKRVPWTSGRRDRIGA